MSRPYALIAGANKTGTTSLRYALDMVYAHLDKGRHLGKRLTDIKSSYSHKRYDNLLKIARDYNILKDHPWNLGDMYKRISEEFPACKVFLTERNPDSWYHSIQEYTSRLYFRQPKSGTRSKSTIDYATYAKNRKLQLEKLYGVKNFDDVEEAKQAYIQRNEEIKAYFENNSNFTCIRVPEDMNWIAIQRATGIEENIIRNNILTAQYKKSQYNKDAISYCIPGTMFTKYRHVGEPIQPWCITNPQDPIDKWLFPCANRQHRGSVDITEGLKKQVPEDVEMRPD